TAITGFAPEALELLTAFHWPGNIRELENMIERLVVLKKQGLLTVADLPEKLHKKAASPPEMKDQFIRFTEDGIHLSNEVEQYENQLIGEAMRKAKGVTARAAQLLHVNRTTLVEKLKRRGIDSKPRVDALPN
ncbi:MAG: helix-turn-helix domain-containing protein, partial [Nitrospirota bacterium]